MKPGRVSEAQLRLTGLNAATAATGRPGTPCGAE